jgi:hypothetical protein
MARAADEVAAPAVFAPALPRGTTRLRATVRPFISVLDQGFGTIADLAVDHYFARAPLRLSLEVAPLALAMQADGPGSIAHVRAGAAYASNYVEAGAAIGGRWQKYGESGLSVAGLVRLGALDGYKLTGSYAFVRIRDRYSGRSGIGVSNALTTFDVPIGRRFTLFSEGGFSSEWWLFATGGLRHRLTDASGRAGWIVSGAVGIAWVFDQPDCVYPDREACTESAWAAGPTLAFGLERRF